MVVFQDLVDVLSFDSPLRIFALEHLFIGYLLCDDDCDSPILLEPFFEQFVDETGYCLSDTPVFLLQNHDDHIDVLLDLPEFKTYCDEQKEYGELEV